MAVREKEAERSSSTVETVSSGVGSGVSACRSAPSGSQNSGDGDGSRPAKTAMNIARRRWRCAVNPPGSDPAP